MELLEIKKNCKIVENKEHNGEELYFDEKPSKQVLDTLKENHYRWHNVKKCWFRKLTYTSNENNSKKTTNKNNKKSNYLGVKIGDIFHYSWGYEQTNANYFQVVALKGQKSVVVREIAYKRIETTGFDSYKVAPCKNEFLEKSNFIKDNIVGATKMVKGLKSGTIYINIESFGFCSLWDGKADNMTCYY